MGMFDYVNFECECSVCGARVTNFQTKSTDCTLSTVSPQEAGNWYSSCGKCGTRIEYNIEPPQAPFLATRSAGKYDRDAKKEVKVSEDMFVLIGPIDEGWGEVDEW